MTVLYVIKWVPRDQDVIIDHTKRYEDPAEALTVAREPAATQPEENLDRRREGGIAHGSRCHTEICLGWMNIARLH